MELTYEREQGVLGRLAERFGLDADQAVIKHNRIYLSVPEADFMDALRFLKEELGFDHLCTITGLDTGENFEFLYHVAEPGGILLTLKFMTREDPVSIQTVLPVFNGATSTAGAGGPSGDQGGGADTGRQYPRPTTGPRANTRCARTGSPASPERPIRS
jgi:hypothetical protein